MELLHDPAIDTAVPVEGAQTRPKPSAELPKLGDYDFEDLKNKFVEVRASSYRYTGTLIGADERDLYLKGVTRWWVLPLDRVSDVRLLSETPPEERKVQRKGPIPGDPNPSMEGEPVTGAMDDEPLPDDAEADVSLPETHDDR